MILTCPECSTRFELPDDAIGPDGARLKCSSCEHIWTEGGSDSPPEPPPPPVEEEPAQDEEALPEEEGAEDAAEGIEEEGVDIPDAVKPVPEEEELPPLPEEDSDEQPEDAVNKTFVGYGAAGGVFLLILIILLLFACPMQRAFPSTNLFYGIFGMSAPLPDEGLIFDKIKAVSHRKHRNITVEGEIINLTSKAKKLPALEISLKGEDGSVLEQWMIEPPSKVLDGEKSVPFETVRDGDWKNVKEVSVHFVLRKASTGAKGGGNTHVPE